MCILEELLCNGYGIDVSKNVRILLANLLQGSRSTFSCVNFPGVSAFQEGMWDTHMSALPGSPTVPHDPGLSTAYENRGAIFRRVSGGFLRHLQIIVCPWVHVLAPNERSAAARHAASAAVGLGGVLDGQPDFLA